jgi:hypothetical protein
MAIIDEKILAVSVIGVLYVLSRLLKPQTILKVVITVILGIITLIWALDFFGLYPLSNLIEVDFYG